MKASDANRAAILAEALDDISALNRSLKRITPANGYSRRVMEIGVTDQCDVGGEGGGEVCIDVTTGRKLVPLLRDLIEQELRAMGVEVED
jgi:hypothetical protein